MRSTSCAAAMLLVICISSAAPAQLVRSASGPNALAIQASVDQFRLDHNPIPEQQHATRAGVDLHDSRRGVSEAQRIGAIGIRRPSPVRLPLHVGGEIVVVIWRLNAVGALEVRGLPPRHQTPAHLRGQQVGEREYPEGE